MKRFIVTMLVLAMVFTAVPIYASEQLVNGYVKDEDSGEILRLEHDEMSKQGPEASGDKVSIVFFGDSIMAGRDGRYLVTPREGATPGSYMIHVPFEESIAGVVESLLPDGYECFNYGLSGTGFLNQGSSYSALKNIEARDFSNVDYVVISYGSNDYTPIFYKLDKATLCESDIVERNIEVYRSQIEACIDAIDGPEVILLGPWDHVGNSYGISSQARIEPIMEEIAREKGVIFIPQDSNPLQDGAFSDGTDSDVMGATSLYNNRPQWHPSKDGYAILGEWLYNEIKDIVNPEPPTITLSGMNEEGFVKSSKELILEIEGESFLKAEIYVNEELFDEIDTKSYTFDLNEGETEDASYEIKVKAFANAKNASEETFSVKIDNIAPRLNISGVDKDFYNSEVEISESVEDKNLLSSTLSIKKNGEEVTGKTLSEEGEYEVTLTAVDKAGNESRKLIGFVIDKTGAEITLTGDVNGYVKSLDELEASASDTIFDKIEVSYGETTLSSEESSLTLEDDGKACDGEEYQIKVTALDKAGNKSEITKKIIKDNVNPVVNITGAEDNGLYNTSVSVQGSATDGSLKGSNLTVTRNGEEVKGEALQRELTESGSYVAKIEATDMAGNSSVKEISFVIDKDKPVVTLSGIEEGMHYIEVPTLNVSSSEEGVIHLTVTLDGKVVDEVENEEAFSYDSFKEDGKYKASAYVVDNAGNKGDVVTLSFAKDEKAPEILVSGVKEGSFNSSDITLKVKITEKNYEGTKTTIDVQKELNGKTEKSELPFESVSEDTEKSYVITENGNYKVTVNSVDQAGNKAVEKTISFTIDKESPSVNLNGMNEDGFVKALNELTASGDDTNFEKLEVKINESLYETSGKELVLKDDDKNLDGEEYKITVTVIDKAGNKKEETFTVLKDNTAPRLSYEGAEEGVRYNKDVTVKTVIDESFVKSSEMIVSLNGEVLEGNMIERQFSDEGDYALTSKVVDKAGNESEISLHFTIDKTDPVATLSGVTGGAYYQDVPKVSANVDEDATLYLSVSLDGKEIHAEKGRGTLSYSDFNSDGDYEVKVYAIDNAGNKGENAVANFVKDTVSPVLSISGPEEGAFVNKDAEITFSVNERNFGTNKVDVSIKRSGSTIPFTFNSDNINSEGRITLSDEGLYEIAITSTDMAGNSAEEKTLSFTIDKTSPTTTISGPEENAYYQNIPAMQVEANENAKVYVEVVRDGEVISSPSGTNTVTISSFDEDGEYTVTAYSIDTAGNKGQEVKRSFVKDTTAPTTGVGGVGPGGHYNETQTIVVSVKERHFGSNNVTVTITKELNGVTESIPYTFNSTEELSSHEIEFANDGHYTVTIQAVDKAGNVSETRTLPFVIDKTMPSVSIAGPEEGAHYIDVPKFTSVASEDGQVTIIVKRDGETVYEGNAENEQAFTAFNTDGNYEVTSFATDRAGNKGEEKRVSFVKDSTAPSLTLSGVNEGDFTNNLQELSLSVVERYFEDAEIAVKITRLLEGKEIDVPFSVNLTGETSNIGIPLQEDGVYTITVSGKDKAGNVSENKSITFTLDRNAPKIELSIPRTENGYDDLVTPSVKISDSFFESKEIKLEKIIGEGLGLLDWEFTETFNETGGERTYLDFAKTKINDGMYKLTATAKDKAGNVSTEELIFVVDRFGSVFVVKSAPKGSFKEIDKAVVIEEINVANITSYEIKIHRDNSVKDAENVKVSKEGNTTTYTIPKSNFMDEGIYRVDIITKDSAGNVSELRSEKETGVWFSVDKTPPVIKYSGVVPGETYIADKIELEISATDSISGNIKLSATVNGKDVEIVDGKVILESGYNQEIKIKAVDEAGNEAEQVISDVTISTNPVVRWYSNKPLFAGSLGGVGLLGLGLILLAVKRNKKDDEEKEDDIDF